MWRVATLTVTSANRSQLCTARREVHASALRLISARIYFPECGRELGVVRSYPRKEGAAVDVGDIVAEVETGPSLVLEVQATHKGTVTKHLHRPGGPVRAGDALVELEVTTLECAKGWWRSLQASAGQE
eukprot:gnl/TRDRNA2_/TRDRNA2_40542_c0_seq1.p1 gnl/TRDRNA2_/TRDRNA2_40542_c0~~gnl/TRDRNA2_/TRDRNA2_40542_c0_seq1.p1  ORF type:complete len:129 (+),score=16.53 gnl/TRDRNA2_/TRDRNA2_40542_c0_seq1:45-431(+)